MSVTAPSHEGFTKWIDEDAAWGFDVDEPECYGTLPEWTMEVIGNIYENPELLEAQKP